MDSKEYLNLCKAHKVKNVGFVMFRGIKYQAENLVISFDKNGKPIYRANLLDKNKNSIVLARLEEITKYNEI